MKFDRSQLIAGGAAALVVAAGLAYWLMSGRDVSQKPPVAEKLAAQNAGDVCKPITTVAIGPDDFTFGKADAPITLVEYASQTCSHCAAFHSEVFPKLDEAYIKTGLVRFVFREFQRNRIDLAASLIGRCLGHEAFIPFTNSLFENQATWMDRADKDVVAGLKEMANRAGMSSEGFEACLKKDNEATRLVDVRDKALKDYCLQGTPTMLMNGKKLGANSTTYEGLDVLLRQELKALGKAAPQN